MVENRWSDKTAQEFVTAAGSDPADQQLALQVYASRLIGSDPTLVQHGGGNTSCKLTRKDLFGNDINVLHVKGSGSDLAQITAAGMPAVRLEALLELRALDRLGDEDMVNAIRGNMLDASGPNPSIETLLHAYLPHAVINHTHATAMLALANLPDAKAVVAEIFGDTIATVEFFMPGFELANAAADVFEQNPKVQGLLLLNHGHFAFSRDAKSAYELIIKQTNMVEDWFADKRPATQKPGPDLAANPQDILPVLRGVIGQKNAEFSENPDVAMPVMELRAGPDVKEFLQRADLETLATRGVATPDHVIRTKNSPLLLSEKTLAGGAPEIAKAVARYVQDYTRYFDQNAARFPDGKIMLNPSPAVAWIAGLGIVAMAQNARAASIAADLAEQNIAAMTMGQNGGGFFPVNTTQLFDMEYWSLEQAKLGRATPPELSGNIVMVTGGAGAIGLATAQAFAQRGANIFLVDLQEIALRKALDVLGPGHDGMAMDITVAGAAKAAIHACCQRFGGLDILISNAGAAWTGEMATLDQTALRKSFELNFFAHQNFSQAATSLFTAQNRGGQILFNVSKQAVNPGKGFGAYGIPKAATFFLLRQLALELGPRGIRVNGVNADRIRSGLLDDGFISARAKARGIDEADYMAGNLLQREVEAHHVADAFVVLALSSRTTAHVMTVDGGNIEAALR